MTRRPLHIESSPSRRLDLRSVPRGLRVPGPDYRDRRSPYPRTRPLEVPVPPAPLRLARGGCRTKVGGVRCSHPERAHRDVGFGGWRARCDGCGCRGYRDPWGRAVAAAVLVGVVVLSLLVLAGRYGALVFPAVDAFLGGLS